MVRGVSGSFFVSPFPLLSLVPLLSFEGGRFSVWVEEGADADHVVADVVGDFCHLFADVTQESIGFPSANEHDHVDWGSCEDHGHCCG
jgi:hypothetical protein